MITSKMRRRGAMAGEMTVQGLAGKIRCADMHSKAATLAPYHAPSSCVGCRSIFKPTDDEQVMCDACVEEGR